MSVLHVKCRLHKTATYHGVYPGHPVGRSRVFMGNQTPTKVKKSVSFKHPATKPTKGIALVKENGYLRSNCSCEVTICSDRGKLATFAPNEPFCLSLEKFAGRTLWLMARGSSSQLRYYSLSINSRKDYVLRRLNEKPICFAGRQLLQVVA